MAITKFSFEDLSRKWRLTETSFSAFTLLVGVSGVGKTQILRALSAVCEAGLESSSNINGCRWMLEVLVNNDKYVWIAETSMQEIEPSIELGGGDKNTSWIRPHYIRETITKNQRQLIVDRDEDRFVFNGKKLPKLKNTESAITLLRDEELIAPLNISLSQLSFSEGPMMGTTEDLNTFVNFGAMMSSGPLIFSMKEVEKSRREIESLSDLQAAQKLPPLIKAYILQEDFPEEFTRLKKNYRDIFPTVSDIKIERIGKFSQTLAAKHSHFTGYFVYGIKEKGVSDWIVGKQISSGMLRILTYLTEITLSLSGMVIIIDEVENSLGNNCLPHLMDHFMRRADLQFIITSHHPYIINNVPMKYWKLVTRKGSVVTVKDAASVRGLDPDSLLSGFVQLTNLEEYEEAIR